MQHAAVQQLLTIRQPFKSQWRRLHIDELFSSETFNNIRSINSTKIVNEKKPIIILAICYVYFPENKHVWKKVTFKCEQDISCQAVLTYSIQAFSE